MPAQNVEPIPPVPPVSPTPPLPTPQQVVVSQQPGASPRLVFEALRAKREVLGEYMSRLLNRRNNVSERLSNPNIGPAEKAALEQHMRELNDRIVDMEKQLHAADAEVAAAAGVPGSTVPEARDLGFDGPPAEMLIIGTVFAGVTLLVVGLAYARRLWRGATHVVAQLPAAFESRFTRVEQALDAIAIEIERVSEGQRFLTKVLGDQSSRALGAGPAQPVEVRAGIAETVRRRE
jgi:hypothetical protein